MNVTVIETVIKFKISTQRKLHLVMFNNLSTVIELFILKFT